MLPLSSAGSRLALLEPKATHHGAYRGPVVRSRLPVANPQRIFGDLRFGDVGTAMYLDWPALAEPFWIVKSQIYDLSSRTQFLVLSTGGFLFTPQTSLPAILVFSFSF
jgi:hypothetical protein